MRLIYSLFLTLMMPLVLLRLYWLGRRNGAYRERWRERLGYPEPLPQDKPVLWVHAVSVGEVLAARPLLNVLSSNYPDFQILVTTTTPTGATTVERNFAERVAHRYFPYDLPGAVRNALRRLHPRLVIVMETELWPNFYAECAAQGIPLIVANARLSERSVRGYRRMPRLIRETLRSASLIAAQSRADAGRFLMLGAAPGRVSVTGNVKFDMSLPHSVLEQGQALRRFFSASRPVWIAASTHAGEETGVLEAFARVLHLVPDCLLILAPRHPERCADIEELCRQAGFGTARRSRMDQYATSTRVFLLDSLGELPVFYASTDVAFVGGSLVPVGGHNVLEPASLGVPVVSGPHLFNFASISELLISARAMQVVASPQQLAECVTRLLQDANLRFSMGESAKRVFSEHRGSTQLLLRALAPYLDAGALR